MSTFINLCSMDLRPACLCELDDLMYYVQYNGIRCSSFSVYFDSVFVDVKSRSL